MKKILLLGRTNYGKLFITVELRGSKNGPILSISGVEGPKKNGDCLGSFGQCIDALDRLESLNEDWTHDKVQLLKDIWKRYHLNDMRPGCPHVPSPSDGTFIEVPSYRASNRYREEMKTFETHALRGPLHPKDYEDNQKLEERVKKFLYPVPPKFPTREAYKAEEQALLSEGWIAVEKVTKAYPGHVWFQTHDDGLLLKPCPICGYAWGSTWNYEAIPIDVLQSLEEFPASTEPCPWSL